ncbi:MAG TPA: 7-carboxy-7-deazaguanine synthase [Candidatus Competibacteraceae bacterium]|nr:7-carboxy-7-deazaguanine synthase [Candidatus Competibacteraceae bacterium]
MTYSVKEIFYTLQGEGAQSGRPAVFCRFSGCNLWSGREPDRDRAICRFCDTDFVGTDGVSGGKFHDAASLADAVTVHWPANTLPRARPYVVCTGGEPLLQLDAALIEAFHARGFEVAVESNGTLPAPPGLDWICVSPKGRAPLRQLHGDELKLVYPQAEPEAQPERFVHLEFCHFFLQPLDGPARAANTRAAVEYCLRHPQWRISLQTHKLLDIP